MSSLFSPVSTDEDGRRREYILTILLVSTIVLFAFAFAFSIYRFITQIEYSGMLPGSILFLFCVFLLLLVLVRLNLAKYASYIFIFIFFSLPIYSIYRWGVDLPAAVLFFALTIVMAGILISTRFSFFITLLTVLIIGSIGFLQNNNIIISDRGWTLQPWNLLDILSALVIFIIIATVSWLSNREIERSLARARKSEAELKEERDMLEVRVQERTEELRQAEMEKLAQTYRFVEFGRLAGGLFHDLMNPLTALSLNIESMSKSGKDNNVGLLADDIERAKKTTAHMQSLMDKMRKHLSKEGAQTEFSINETIGEIVMMLDIYAKNKRVKLHFKPADIDCVIVGDPVHFTQIVSNLISNAVESYRELSNAKGVVEVVVGKSSDGCNVKVQDWGIGILKEDQEKIFDPFVSTKKAHGGFGLGLSLAKRMLEREFKGSISVEGELNKGTTFVLHFPVN